MPVLGAIVGDVIGSTREHARTKTTDFELFPAGSRFTDDTVLTVATAHAIMTGTPYGEAYHLYGNRYPRAGYGGSFKRWLAAERPQPYNSWGNGSAMRVSPVAWAFDSIPEVLHEAALSASVTHDHPEGIRGAQAAALAVYLGRTGHAREEIRDRVVEHTGYDLSRSIADIRPSYEFDVSCQGSVPEAIIAFLESDSVESAIRLAVSLGGDADTQAAIAGSIAEAFYRGVPEALASAATARLNDDLRSVLTSFHAQYPDKKRQPSSSPAE